MTTHFRIRRYLLYALLVLANFCFSQSKQFQHLTSADGISQSEVYCFLEDSQGFMWFGTVDGLNRYDGYEVITFHTDKDNHHSITNNTIRCLAEDEAGRIWIGTDDGLSVFETKLEKVHQIHLEGLKEGRLTVSTALFHQGQLYLGTSLGLLLLDVQPKALNQIDKNAHRIKWTNDQDAAPIVACRPSQDGGIWATTANALYKLKLAINTKTPTLVKVLDLAQTLPDIRNLAEDSFGNLWIVSHDHGFVKYSPTSKRLQAFKKDLPNSNISSDKVSSVSIDKKGNLWIGTHDKGLFFLEKEFLQDENPSFQAIKHDPYNNRSLNSNLIYALFVSRSNLLWIGTIGAGINIYNPYRKPFQYYSLHNASKQSSYSTNFIRAVYADQAGNLWIGAHNNGLFFYDRSDAKNIEKIGFGTEAVFHLNDAGAGKILVCTGKGISLVKKVGSRTEVMSTLPIGATFYVTKVENGLFWVASLAGVKQCRLAGGKITIEREYTTETQPAISFNNCRVLNFNKQTNQLFIGTEGGGLNVLQFDAAMAPLKNTIYQKKDSPNSLSNNYLRSIIQTSNADVWIGTYEGLNKMSIDATSGEAVFRSYTKKSGLPNNTIQSIVEDNQQNLWISTNQGLCKFNPDTEVFAQYTLNDGIQSNEFSEHTIFKRPDNEIIVGGINGINTFYPEEIVADDFQANITLTDFYLSNKRVGPGEIAEEGAPPTLKESIVFTDSIFLSPNQNSFGFDFSAMVYNAPEKVQYAYMLEGFDEEWLVTDAKNRKANYTNLAYGNYTFRVKATNNDGLWEEAPKSVFISIKTPFYYTTLAFLLYGILGLLGVFFLANYSILRHTTKNKILLENQHSKKIRELEELRTQFFINVSHDLRTPLTLISSPLEVALANKTIQPEVKNLLNLVSRNVKKLREMTEELLDFRKAETNSLAPKLQNLDLLSFVKKEASFFEDACQSKGIDLLLEGEEGQEILGFDPDMISKVIFNMLSNALKHTSKGSILVSINKSAGLTSGQQELVPSASFMRIRFADSGDGIDEADLPNIFERFYQGREQNKQGYGVGLSHSKDLVEAHNGYVEVRSEKGVGTTFDVYLPLIQAAVAIEDEAIPVVKEGTPVPTKKTGVAKAEINQEGLTVAQEISVLLVEDNPDLRLFLSNELKKQYTVLEAQDGEEGLMLASKHFPDLIISDVMMPKMDGMEFCTTIKSDLKTSHIPVILLTAKVGKESKYEGLEIGADEYIAKPFEMRYLLLKIRNLLKSRDRMRELFRTSIELAPSRVTVTSIDESFLLDLMTEIEKGISDFDFSIKRLEQKIGMSHASFYNKIKSLTGQSAKELIFSMRMKRAKQILEDTQNIRISEVAYMVGFSDPKYFSKRFKEYFGETPSGVVNW